MLFKRQFGEFDFEAFYSFLRNLGEEFAFHNILFTPDKLHLFTAEQLSHAAPNHDLSAPNSFVGRWKHLQSEVRHVRFSYESRTGTPSIEIEINLDRRSIALLKVSGMESHIIDEILQLCFPMSQRFKDESVPSPSCFISYSNADKDFAQRLHDDLQNSGVRCWFAPHDVKGGRKLYEQIDEAIRIHDRLLLIVSEQSMASNWVNTEIANARQREMNEGKRVLFPIRLVDFQAIKEWKCFDADTGIDSAREIREYFIPDFSNWTDDDSYKKAFERLLRDLTAEES